MTSRREQELTQELILIKHVLKKKQEMIEKLEQRIKLLELGDKPVPKELAQEIDEVSRRVVM